MDEQVRIRQATEADLPALTRMTRAFNDYLDGLGGKPPAADAQAVAAAAMERLRPMAFGPDPICTVLMAERDGEAAGYVTTYVGVYMDDATPVVHVADFYVDERHRRHGVGKALMREARRRAEARGAARLCWTVWDKNVDAIRFYEALGAQADVGAIVMEWPIAR